MGKLEDRVLEAGQLLGFPPRLNSPIVFGVKDSFPVQMMIAKKGDSRAFYVLIRWDAPAKDTLALERIKSSMALKDAKVKASDVNIAAGVLEYTQGLAFSWRSLTAEAIVQKVRALLDEVKAAVGSASVACRTCGQGSPEVSLVNGVVDRICAGCLQKAQADAQALAEAYEALPTRWGRAILVGGVLALVGAVLWDAVLFWTQRMYWLLAIAIGGVIGWGTTKAAGKGGRGIQFLAGAFTLVSVVGAMVALHAIGAFASAFEGGQWNVALFWRGLLSGMAQGWGDLAFTAAGALIGAWVAAGAAGKPTFQVTVEK
jgi:hypothetical protein